MSDDPILAALARLEAGQTDVSARLTQLEASHTAMRGEMAAFRSGVTDELGKTRGAISEKLADVQAALTAIRDDIAVNMGSVEGARLANENTRADVKQMQEQMSVMWRQLKRLEARLRDITGDP